MISHIQKTTQGNATRQMGIHSAGSRGFSLIELMVAISIIAIMIGILVPALSQARRAARLAQCSTNVRQILPAFESYAADFNYFLPGYATPVFSSSGYNVLGKQGAVPNGVVTGMGVPAGNRPLNEYLGNAFEIARCPLDIGFGLIQTPTFRTDTAGHESLFDAAGSSYYYPERPNDNVINGTKYGRGKVWAAELHRYSEVGAPSKKLIIGDATYWANDSFDINYWHGDNQPLNASMGFLDGHVIQEPRKEEDYAIVENPLTDSLLKEWMNNEPYY